MNDKINNDEAFKELFYQEEDAKDKVEESVKTIFAYFDNIKAENIKLKETLNVIENNFDIEFYDGTTACYITAKQNDNPRGHIPSVYLSEEDYKLIKGWLEK